MSERKLVIGIDTSNYKTSVAVVGLDNSIVSDVRVLLRVKQGERGLRQSDALFQHIENLPALTRKALFGVDKNDLVCISVSSKPRPVEGSYMPCFNAGLSLSKSFGALLDVPVYEFSHQEGHIEAVTNGTPFETKKKFIAYHLSGGTCEMLKVVNDDSGYDISIIGGSKDISYGQVLDRAGVAMGLEFPSGKVLDDIAMMPGERTNLLKGITVDNLEINLSGIDTQFRRCLERDDIDSIEAMLVRELFHRISASLVRITENAVKETGIKSFAFVGGVSSSRYVRNALLSHFNKSGIELLFGDPDLSQDNAVGTALLGVKKYGKTR